MPNFATYEQDGALLTLNEIVLKKTLNRGDAFLIFLSLCVLYHEKILKTLSHEDYCRKLCFWSKGLDPETEEPVCQGKDYYEPLTIEPQHKNCVICWVGIIILIF